jgi:hypothetical protein
MGSAIVAGTGLFAVTNASGDAAVGLSTYNTSYRNLTGNQPVADLNFSWLKK